jgi:DNA processing protein
MKSAKELESWISLWRVSGVGPKHFQKVLNHFGDPARVFEANTSAITEAGISQNLANTILDKNNTTDSVAADLEWLAASEKHHIITIECEEYPPLLKQISDPPALLYVHGNLALLKDPQLAIVGSRNPTQGGASSAYEFAKHLAQTGFCITSGLALGIDGKAHKGALDADAPTIAVIATGIDRVYPARHRDLAHAIVEHGAIVSEFPLGTQPHSANFPRRNRIISGLSYGTLVVEAAQQSGSLITARLAMEQNREVFAIPGSIHNPLARGCHQLIRQGAKLVETAQDILEEMASVIDLNNTQTPNMEFSAQQKTAASNQNSNTDSSENNLNPEQNLLLEHMGFDPVSIDQLVMRSGLNPSEIAAMLLILELQNQVASNGGGTYTRLK